MTGSSRPIAFVNARLIDPASAQELRGGVLVEDGIIQDYGRHIVAETVPEGTRLVDCNGDVIAPGLIDLRAFVGEPGAEHRETIASASAAAAAGGVTTVIAMPDTQPPVDDPAVVDFLIRRARDIGRVRVLPAAALTKGLKGREIAEIGLLKAAGAVAFTDGSASISNSQVMRRALTYARDFDALIMHYTEDCDLVGNGVMNEGELASRLGLAGIPREAETIILERDLRLVGLTRARYHAALISNRLSLDVLERAKRMFPVSCSASINHLTLNETDIGDYRTFLKLAPPLRCEDERRSLVAALATGLIDTIVSDHNPQDVETKRLPFAEAANGAIGLETMLAAALRLVHAGEISLPKLIVAMTLRPAEILGLPQGRLQKSAPADLIRFDPDEPYIIDPAKLHSRCRNTPFDEARLQGIVKMTMVAGEIVYG
jgi:dihydroorotase